MDLLDQHGLSQHDLAGLSPAINPLSALSALVRHKLAHMSFAELGSKLKLDHSADLSISYMGFALRST